MTPSHLVIFLKGNLLRISSGLEVMLGYFCFAECGVLELSRDYCWFHWFLCAWFILGSSEFSFLLNRLGSNLQCLLFLILDLARSYRACFCFYSILSLIFVSCRCLSVSFLVMYCIFLFFQTPFRLFSCSVPSNPIRWQLMSIVCLFSI